MQVWYENMNEPCYENTGPTAEYVRDEVEKSYWKLWKKGEPELNCLLIQKCIDRIIPETRNDFGSWRGYTSFRMKEKLINRVRMLYDKEIEDAKILLSEKFIPFVQHKLYKPGGIMTKKIEERFNINKNILNKKKK